MKFHCHPHCAPLRACKLKLLRKSMISKTLQQIPLSNGSLELTSMKSLKSNDHPYCEGILPKGSYPPCLRMADRALLAGYPRLIISIVQSSRGRVVGNLYRSLHITRLAGLSSRCDDALYAIIIAHSLQQGFLKSRVMRGGRSLAGISMIRRTNPTPKAEDPDAWCQQVISRLAPPDERVFSFNTVLLLLLWRRRSEIFRSAFLLRDTPCSTTWWWIT